MRVTKKTLVRLLLIFTIFVAGMIFAFLLSGRGFNPFVHNTSEWAIGIYSGRSPYQLAPDARCTNPVLRPSDVSDIPAEFVADPFMIRVGQTWYIFFEALNSKSKKGDIAFASSIDGTHWKYEHVVIAEDYHLSYPYVFSDQGRFYLIPESYQAKAVLLFEATEFPNKWVVADTLLRGEEFVDNSVFEAYGHWWMFTTPRAKPGQCRLFYSDRLRGPWIEHPRSPIVASDKEKSRPGGRVIQYRQHFVRFAQIDYPTYGRGVNAFEILRLTTTEYEEKPVDWNPVLFPRGEPWTAAGMHTLDAHMIDDTSWFACVDGVRTLVRLPWE